MAQPEIESQPPAGNAAFRHGPGRTVLLVAGMLAWAAFFGYRVTRHPDTLWFTALVVLCGAAMAHKVLAVVIQSVRGIPLLQASEAGIAINDPCGRMLVRWSDAEDFSVATSRGIRIRLREGARPIGSMWSIGWWYCMDLIGWERGIIKVPTSTAVAAPSQIAETLASLRSRYVPVERSL